MPGLLTRNPCQVSMGHRRLEFRRALSRRTHQTCVRQTIGRHDEGKKCYGFGKKRNARGGDLSDFQRIEAVVWTTRRLGCSGNEQQYKL